MNRLIYENLYTWAKSHHRKPLVLQGARQVGKTFAVSTFGKKHFSQLIKIDFLADDAYSAIFNSSPNFSPRLILEQLEFYLKKTINPDTDLLFMDEIQECPSAITSLKYFFEEMPQLAIIGAGSYLGIMTTEESFPVGKVDFLSMTPCTFDEYLGVANQELKKILDRLDVNDHSPIPQIYHDAFLNEWRTFLALGGMPEVIMAYLNHHAQGPSIALAKARVIQEGLLEGYQSDFAKHAGKTNATHIVHVFDSVAQQLSKSYDESVNRYYFTGVLPKQK